MDVEPVETTEVQLVVCETDWLGAIPSHMWAQDLVVPTNQEQMLRPQLEALTVDGEFRVAHRIVVSGGRTSWGADSGEHLSIILYLTSAVGTAAIGAAVNELYGRLRNWQKELGTRSEYWSSNFSREEAIERARWIIQSKFQQVIELQNVETDLDDLRLISERSEIDSNRWIIGLEDTRGVKYEVTFGFEENIPVCVTIERTNPTTRQIRGNDSE